jgi:hypothetical protein
MKKYILDSNGCPVLEPDVMKWAHWFEKANRTVAMDTVGGSIVSTVFLGIDHGFDGGPPILWETMVFSGKLDHEQDRCSGSREQAEAMHARMVKRVKA